MSPEQAKLRALIIDLRQRIWDAPSPDEAFLRRHLERAQELTAEGLLHRLITRYGEYYSAALARQLPGLLLTIIDDALVDYRAGEATKKAIPPPKPAMTHEEFRAWVASLPADERADLARRDPSLADLVEEQQR